MAQDLLARLRRESGGIAWPLSPEGQFEIARSAGVSWIGMRIGRRDASDVHEVQVDDRSVVILRQVETRVRATGRVINSAFALLTVSSGETSRLQLLEDGAAIFRADGVVRARGAAR